ncbi:hypothetical protein [Magnetospirillum aberrantis]|uniref:Uncharacterized protein n=1 Tax=Magnetospirillum aberrantis SpK TaxID=908842 RepID=A0A7C9QUA6_9PROT|nr:hypothetical protein [Magnetospirillum aberrantis]NFV79476.1 hypothetical protein [Magnetospirillum aberrantis SpK]
MKLFPILRVLSLLVLAVGLSGCGESWSWKQKITVEVETPEGVKRASSVIHHRLDHYDGWWVFPEARRASSHYTGEAVVLEVSPGRYLFALLNGTPDVFPIFFPGEAPVKIADRFATLRAARTVPPKLYPLLVTFGDLADPTSVQRVDPADLAATFGPGVRLKSITLEITDEPVTEGRVEKVLGWLDDVWPNQLDGQKYETIKAENRFANSLSTGNFSTEVKQ